MMAADVDGGGATLRVTSVRRLFSNPDLLGRFAVAHDGRLLAIQRTAAPELATQIHVVVNWSET